MVPSVVCHHLDIPLCELGWSPLDVHPPPPPLLSLCRHCIFICIFFLFIFGFFSRSFFAPRTLALGRSTLLSSPLACVRLHSPGQMVTVKVIGPPTFTDSAHSGPSTLRNYPPLFRPLPPGAANPTRVCLFPTDAPPFFFPNRVDSKDNNVPFPLPRGTLR